MYIWSYNWLEWLLIISYVQLSVLLAAVIFLATRRCFCIFLLFNMSLTRCPVFFKLLMVLYKRHFHQRKKFKSLIIGRWFLCPILLLFGRKFYWEPLLVSLIGAPRLHIRGRFSCSKKHFRFVWSFFHLFSFNQCSWSPSFLGTFVLIVTWNHSCIGCPCLPMTLTMATFALWRTWETGVEGRGHKNKRC